MNGSLNFDRETGCMTVQGELTIYQAKEAAEVLRAAVGTGELACLDLSGVTELDTAGLQLLMVAARLKNNSGEPIGVTAASDVVQQALSFAGVSLAQSQPQSREARS
ncbi:lipid asymmetry maintenance protein MlaB [Marinobacter sp.]|uniref:STAS domain-containing protein n=1 Tax=Marinobacter sp. TaxID=50741 RepID=UPI003850B0AB